MPRMRIVLLTLMLGLLPIIDVLMPQSVSAAENIVIQDGSEQYPCNRAGLVAAIGAANGGTVTFDCEDSLIPIDSEIDIPGAVTIDGENGDGDQIILDGGKSSSIFFYAGSDLVTLQRLTLRNGRDSDVGAAVYNRGAMKIIECTFRDNWATLFGGAIATDGTLEISQSRFINNYAGDAGAIDNSGRLEINQSTFTNNRADYYAGAIGNNATLEISQSSFSQNHAGGEGGAIVNVGGQLTVSSSSFVANTADLKGGAIRNLWGNATLSTSTLSDNTADVAGSAIDGGTGQVAIDWSTIVQPADTAPALAVTAEVTLEGVILGGEGEHCGFYGGSISATASLANDDSCVATVTDDWEGQELGLAERQTKLMSYGVEQSYYPLPESSLAVNTGGTMCDTPDQLGTIRPVGRICDIGAIESPFISFDPVDLCANRWTGDLRMPSYDRCASTELSVHIGDGSPVTICANRWTGEARYGQYGRCASTERIYEVMGMNMIGVCVNRWTGALRIDSRCYSTEWSDQL